jgi:hypothetical protein
MGATHEHPSEEFHDGEEGSWFVKEVDARDDETQCRPDTPERTRPARITE